jgi:hypothetical protein
MVIAEWCGLIMVINIYEPGAQKVLNVYHIEDQAFSLSSDLAPPPPHQ